VLYLTKVIGSERKTYPRHGRGIGFGVTSNQLLDEYVTYLRSVSLKC
jgi:hypothetical protein